MGLGLARKEDFAVFKMVLCKFVKVSYPDITSDVGLARLLNKLLGFKLLVELTLAELLLVASPSAASFRCWLAVGDGESGEGEL